MKIYPCTVSACPACGNKGEVIIRTLSCGRRPLHIAYDANGQLYLAPGWG